MRDEFLEPAATGDIEEVVEAGLRPRRLDEFVGQRELKDHLGIVLEAARRREQAVDHLLFAGPPGLGKTTLATIVATEMDVQLHVTSGPALERAGDLAAILTKLGERDVLFIDEIHRLSRAVEEILYPAMEDFQLDIVVGKGPAASQHPPHAAAVHPRRRHHPHRDDHRPAPRPLRPGRPPRLLRRGRARRPSSCGPPASSACTSTRRAPGRSPAAPGAPPGSPTACCAASATSPRSAATAPSTPRRPSPGCRCSVSTCSGSTRSTAPCCRRLCEQFGGGPVGLSTLAIAVGEQTETVEDVYEPFLIQQGLIARTPRGRVAMPLAYAHLGLTPPRRSEAAARAVRLTRRRRP